MSKKLLDILPTLQDFQNNVISQLTNMFNGVEWLNDTTSYTKQETIYKLLILKYGDRHIRYDDENIFLNRLVFDLADFLPDIYAKQQVFIKNKLNEFLSDNKNRAVVIDNTSTNTRNTDNNSKFGSSSSPLNIVISNANEITNAPITSLNLSNVKLLENYNGNNQQVNYNFVNDLIKTLNSDYSLRLNEFMELLGKHFISVVGSYYRNQNDIQTVKDEPYRFNNGYLVNEVDYLCADNKQEINRFNEKLGRLNDQVATKQNQLTAGNNISINNNVISANVPQPDLSNYVQKNGNLQIVNAFVDFYGNIVAKNNGYVDNVDVATPTSMVNIQHLNNTINPINTNITANTTEIARVDSVVNTNSTNITNLTNTVNNEVVKLAGAQTITGAKTFTGRTTFGTEINAGWGGNQVKFIPDDDRTKTLQFYNANATDQRRFNLLIAEPTEAQNPATKNYVDNAIATAAPTDLVNRIQAVETKSNTNETNITTNATTITNLQTKVDTLFNRRVENATINVGAQAQFRALPGYEIVNVMVGRKRSDNYMFFTYDQPLNFQVFVHPNGQWTVYNSGTPNRFTNDFQMTILEKKV